MPNVAEIWVYLSGSPLLALTLTLCAYQIGLLVHERCGSHPLATPGAIAILFVAAPITAIPDAVLEIFRGRAIRAFLAGHGDGLARRTGLSGAQRVARTHACAWSHSGRRRGHFDRQRGRDRAVARRRSIHHGRTLCQEPDHTDRDGRGRTHRRLSDADGGLCREYRRARRRARPLPARRSRLPRLVAARLRDRNRGARHRHLARIRGPSGSRRIRESRDGPARYLRGRAAAVDRGLGIAAPEPVRTQPTRPARARASFRSDP